MRCSNCNANNVEGGIFVMNDQIPLCEDCIALIEQSEDGLLDAILANIPSIQDAIAQAVSQQNEQMDDYDEDEIDPIVRAFGGEDLTKKALNGEIDPVIGRDPIIDKVIEVLNRRTKNSPVLLGDPAVGKTAIIEGLALRVANGDVPAMFKRKYSNGTDEPIKIISMSAADLNKGLQPAAGALEAKLEALIKAVKSRKNVILFMDELHQIVGTGNLPGIMDAGNILKPHLARSGFNLIGATTTKEYRKFIERDSALERRFEKISVDEPTRDESVEILKGIRTRYEIYHSVEFPNEVIEACVDLSIRYITDRKLPDKAIDLLDLIGSKLNLSIVDKKAELDLLTKQKENAVLDGNLISAQQLGYKIKAVEKTPDKIVTKISTVEDVKVAIEQKTGIPVRKLEEEQRKNLLNLDKVLSSKIIGQEKAVRLVSEAVKRNSVGLKGERPSSFLFTGPTGVGKTEFVYQLAQLLFGNKEDIIRIDMSEYMEKHSVSKLIGSPPGYIGHDEAGQLTEKVRKKPYSIVLLDEIEKAHPDVLNTFLQVLDAGHLTDSQGRKVSFKDTVVIATSNAGSSVKKTRKLGFGDVASDDSLTNDLTEFFTPEFLNRFDAVIKFNSLEKSHLLQIVDLMLGELNLKLEKQGVQITVSKSAKEKLVELGYNPAFGARPLRRVIQNHVENKLADAILANNKQKYSVRLNKQSENLYIA